MPMGMPILQISPIALPLGHTIPVLFVPISCCIKSPNAPPLFPTKSGRWNGTSKQALQCHRHIFFLIFFFKKKSRHLCASLQRWTILWRPAGVESGSGSPGRSQHFGGCPERRPETLLRGFGPKWSEKGNIMNIGFGSK